MQISTLSRTLRPWISTKRIRKRARCWEYLTRSHSKLIRHKKATGSIIKTKLIYSRYTPILKKNCGTLWANTPKRHSIQKDLNWRRIQSLEWVVLDSESGILTILKWRPSRNQFRKLDLKEVSVQNRLNQNKVQKQMQAQIERIPILSTMITTVISTDQITGTSVTSVTVLSVQTEESKYSKQIYTSINWTSKPSSTWNTNQQKNTWLATNLKSKETTSRPSGMPVKKQWKVFLARSRTSPRSPQSQRWSVVSA